MIDSYFYFDTNILSNKSYKLPWHIRHFTKDISLTNKAFCRTSCIFYSKLSSLKEDADLSINNQIKDLKVKIDQQQDILNKKRDRLSDDLIEDREFEISVKQQRLERLQSNTSQMKKQIVYRKFNQWKGIIKSQVGKKKGKYLISRAAEKAIYDCLAENAKAHRRRHGEKGTSYINKDSQRIQSKEMRMIANKALKQLNEIN